MKITLREIFLILVVAAVSIGWAVDRNKLATERELLGILERKYEASIAEANERKEHFNKTILELEQASKQNDNLIFRQSR